MWTSGMTGSEHLQDCSSSGCCWSALVRIYQKWSEGKDRWWQAHVGRGRLAQVVHVCVCHMSGEHMAPRMHRGKKASWRNSVMLCTMFCWGTVGPGTVLDLFREPRIPDGCLLVGTMRKPRRFRQPPVWRVDVTSRVSRSFLRNSFPLSRDFGLLSWINLCCTTWENRSYSLIFDTKVHSISVNIFKLGDRRIFSCPWNLQSLSLCTGKMSTLLVSSKTFYRVQRWLGSPD